MIKTLSDAITPDRQQFFDAYAAGRLLCIRGWTNKFHDLTSWTDLNQILLRHQFDFPRMRLLREGTVLSSETYLKYVPNRRRSGSFRPKLSIDSFNQQLREGATLVIDNVDEVSPGIMDLAMDTERMLRERIHVNLYAAWNSVCALDLHWDDHDVLAIQVIGKKRWSVHGMTRNYPLALDSPPQPVPSQAVVWDGMLEAGDLLYVPRGWWHQVSPVGEPSIHLTFGVYKNTGIDLIEWLTGKLRSHEIFRQDLPRLASSEQKAEHVKRLKAELLACWSADMLDQYFQNVDGMAEPRPFVGLPLSLITESSDLPEDTQVRLTASRPIVKSFDHQKNAINFLANGKRWEFQAAAAAIFQELAGFSAKSIRELCDAAPGTCDREAVREFLLKLLQNGLITSEHYDHADLPAPEPPARLA